MFWHFTGYRPGGISTISWLPSGSFNSRGFVSESLQHLHQTSGPAGKTWINTSKSGQVRSGQVRSGQVRSIDWSTRCGIILPQHWTFDVYCLGTGYITLYLHKPLVVLIVEIETKTEELVGPVGDWSSAWCCCFRPSITTSWLPARRTETAPSHRSRRTSRPPGFH